MKEMGFVQVGTSNINPKGRAMLFTYYRAHPNSQKLEATEASATLIF